MKNKQIYSFFPVRPQSSSVKHYRPKIHSNTEILNTKNYSFRKNNSFFSKFSQQLIIPEYLQNPNEKYQFLPNKNYRSQALSRKHSTKHSRKNSFCNILEKPITPLDLSFQEKIHKIEKSQKLVEKIKMIKLLEYRKNEVKIGKFNLTNIKMHNQCQNPYKNTAHNFRIFVKKPKITVFDFLESNKKTIILQKLSKSVIN